VKWTSFLLNKSYKKLYQQVRTLYSWQIIHRQSYIKKKKERWTPCSSRSMSPHSGASCSGLSQEPIFTSNRKEKMETENLSTAGSRFGLRSATDLVGDKEPRLAPKPSSVATLVSASGASGGCDIGAQRWARNEQLREVFLLWMWDHRQLLLDDYVSAEDRTRSSAET